MPRKKIITNRKECIIQSAIRLFNHYGLEKTTMEDISREAGIPRATIYLEFPAGKEDILMASIKRYQDETFSAMRELAKQSRVGRLETLKQVILHNILRNHDHVKDFQYSHPTLISYAKKVRIEMESFYQLRQEFFIELLKQAALGGEIPSSLDYTRIATILEYGFASFMPPLSNSLSREDLERDSNAFFSMLLSGMAKNPNPLLN